MSGLPDPVQQEFAPIEITGFTRDETASHMRGVWKGLPDDWIDDLHYLSGGNPRVQQYAMKHAGAEPQGAVEYLRPNGKNLEQVFAERMEEARQKVGLGQQIQRFCAAVVALPRPVPVSHLAAVTKLADEHVRDLCADLAPGIRLSDELIRFADEDFEHFLRDEAGTEIDAIRAPIAQHLLDCHQSDAYAAAHLAPALLAAGHRQKILELASPGHEPTIIGDSLLRRQVKLQRLRIAMKVCRETGNTEDALLTLLSGAEALKTEAEIRSILIDNPDLTACFAQDASVRALLRDPEEIERHGPLLLHLMAADARDGQAIWVREEHRQFQAWMQRRSQGFEEQKLRQPNTCPHGWSISAHDIAAETEAVLRTRGPREAREFLLQWRPREVALQVASILSHQLIARGEAELVEACVADAPIGAPWDLFLLVPLALSGRPIDLTSLERSLACLLRRNLIHSDRLRANPYEESGNAEYLDTILTACEILVARGGDHEPVLSVLRRFAAPELRRRDRLSVADVSFIDVSLRSHALLERLAGREVTLETYVVDPPDPPQGFSAREIARRGREDREKREQLQTLIGPLVAVYDTHVQALVGAVSPADLAAELQAVISRYYRAEYRMSRDYLAHAMKTRAALSLTHLMAVSGLASSVLLERTNALMGEPSGALGLGEAAIFESLALDRSVHAQILEALAGRAEAVKDMKLATEDKLTALIELARLLVPISSADARSLFTDAIEVAGGIDAEAIHEIAVFVPLAERAVSSMSVQKRRAVAHNLAIVVGDAAIRLEGRDGFPWAEAAQALTVLDVSFALACKGRWEDSGIAGHDLMPSVLETALSNGQLSPSQVIALSFLSDDASTQLLARAVQVAHSCDSVPDPRGLSEELAKAELLRFGHGNRPQAASQIEGFLDGDAPGYWLDSLIRTTAFHEEAAAKHTDRSQEEGQPRDRAADDEKAASALSCVDWSARRFDTASDIGGVIDRVKAGARAANAYVSTSAILDRMRSAVQPGDRAAHLAALADAGSREASGSELARAIVECVDSWSDMPSVKDWCRDGLLPAVVKRLPSFSSYLAFGQSPLPDLLSRSAATDCQICTALLDGIEKQVEALDAPTILALVGLAGRYCASCDAVTVMESYASRLVRRIP